MKAKNKWNRITSSLFIISLMTSLFALQGCSNSSDPEPVDANPTGYYDATGTATVKLDDNTTDLNISDLQGMVNSNDFTAMSVATGLVYHGTISALSINSFNASVSIYRDGTLLTSATIAGTITEGSSITGTLTGTGAGNGTFSLTYAMTNTPVAALSRVETAVDVEWNTFVGGSTLSSNSFDVDAGGSLAQVQKSTDGVFTFCEVASGTISPVAGTNIYTVEMTLTLCTATNVNGTYTGLASSQTESVTDDRLVLVVSNTNFTLNGVFRRR